EIETVLKEAFGARKVNWLRHGDIVGDDTDGHIDTLARLAPDNTILYVSPKRGDIELRLMEEELRELTDADGTPYSLVPLPQPDSSFDEDGNPMPATYANFLIVNGAVIVPTYGQPENDDLALGIISETFPDYVVKAVDCRPLITQHGSLHCSTMQLITQI
ncbi:MAG: agmatine deiminase family protein, partial [Muribaculaceae bacterium]|nr:agmatine deiminase family protein [Muribaculaceae bacterium]